MLSFVEAFIGFFSRIRKWLLTPISPFVLLYYASHEGKVQVVGPIFRKENYGIVFPDKSPLRKRVNEALLKLRENGAYDQLYKKWFGGNGS